MRHRRAFLRFIFYKILPFPSLRIIFKKYYWITLFVFVLGLFYKAENQSFIGQSLKLKEFQLGLQRTQEELKRFQLLNNQQGSSIINLQKEILKWNQKYNQLSLGLDYTRFLIQIKN